MESYPRLSRGPRKETGDQGPMAAALVPSVKLVEPRYEGSTERLP